jgi:hypothetical protein
MRVAGIRTIARSEIDQEGGEAGGRRGRVDLFWGVDQLELVTGRQVVRFQDGTGTWHKHARWAQGNGYLSLPVEVPYIISSYSYSVKAFPLHKR